MSGLAEVICRKIHEEIAAGIYAPGDKIPSERELEQNFRVSRATINRALTQLHARGLVERRRGSGTFVVEAPPKLAEPSMTRRLVKYIASGAKVRGDVYVSSGHEGMCNELNKHGKDLVTRFYYSEQDYLAELQSLTDPAFAAALIWHSASRKGDRLLWRLLKKGIRFVLLDSYSAEFDCDYVVTDNVNGSQQMVRYLVSQGHRNIVYVTKRTAGLSSLESRQVGFVQEMIANGLPLTHESVCTFDDRDEGDLERVVDSILARNPRPTAIFVANDLHAFDVYYILKKRGLRVPQDISLAGFDDIDRSKHFEVPLTTIAQNFYEMGRAAAAIAEKLQHETERELFYQLSLKPSLVVRESVAALEAK